MELFASCLVGIEALVADELEALGAERVRPLKGGVAFFGDAEVAYRSCLWSRLASRITLIVARFGAADADELYRNGVQIRWEDVVPRGSTFAIHAHGENDRLRNTQFTALRLKDAVCDEVLSATGSRPHVNPKRPDVSLDLRLRGDTATVSLDLSGGTLYARPYLFEDDSQDAPSTCAKAAALLASLGWAGACDAPARLVDPVCGVGELLCEAASVLTDKAPGLGRTSWGFSGWASHDEALWKSLIAEAQGRFERGLARFADAANGGEAPRREDSDRGEDAPIVGYTPSSSGLSRARRHLRKAGLTRVASVLLRVEGRLPWEGGSKAAPLDEAGGGVAVACVLAGSYEMASEARRASDAAAFTSAARAFAPSRGGAGKTDAPDATNAPDASPQAAQAVPTKATCRTACVTPFPDEMSARYGARMRARESWGASRALSHVLFFAEPPAARPRIEFPDPKDGLPLEVEVYEENSSQFASRLQKVAKERRKWARREGVTCYRVYDADLPDYSCAIDLYEGEGKAAGVRYAYVAEYAAPRSIDPRKAARRFADVVRVVPSALGVRPDHVFTKVRRRDKGGSQYRGSARKRGYVTRVGEGGFIFEVDFTSYLDTGLFLDQRLTRELIMERARGARFLNLFAYTGSATVYAAGGGAKTTTTVDLSPTYLEWAERNMRLNGYEGEGHSFERGDAQAWVTDARRSGRRFDLVFVDPPTFSNSKRLGKRVWDVQRDHAELLIGVSRLLSEEGAIVFSCNLRSFKLDEQKLQRYGVAFEDISEQTIPEDFQRNKRIHKCFVLHRSDVLPA